MSAEPVPLPSLTFEEYLKFEELSQERHEFVGGQVYVMTGGTQTHDFVVQAISARLYGAFRAKGCPTFVFNRKLTIGESVYYPDLFVTCTQATHRQYETDAAWVVEVLSDSTYRYDEREKAAAYAPPAVPAGVPSRRLRARVRRTRQARARRLGAVPVRPTLSDRPRRCRARPR